MHTPRYQWYPCTHPVNSIHAHTPLHPCTHPVNNAIVGRKNEHGQSELALNELNWKPLSERRTQFVASLMYKITHDLAPLRLTDIFLKTPSSQHYNLRGSSTKLHLPKLKTEYLKKVLAIEGLNCGIVSQMN